MDLTLKGKGVLRIGRASLFVCFVFNCALWENAAYCKGPDFCGTVNAD